MTNFKINFSQPWLLLLLIPAFALTFFLYFRISKRYRRTRNRIVSMVLHFIVITLSTFVLSGIHFTYEIPNLQTEVILLVDSSYSGDKTEDKKEQFIQSAINDSKGVRRNRRLRYRFYKPLYCR